MKKRSLFVAILAMIFALGLAIPQGMAADMTAEDFVSEAKKDVCEVSVSEAMNCLDEGGYIFLDCREPKEFKMGHIPGAINIPRGLMEFKVTKEIPNKEANILVYCKVGGRGCLTTCTLCRMGYENVKNIAGGWKAWVKAGYPVE
ncbi:MAG: rhodanese-like domain-containing protein [Desulfatiglandaceae bacterium]